MRTRSRRQRARAIALPVETSAVTLRHIAIAAGVAMFVFGLLVAR